MADEAALIRLINNNRSRAAQLETENVNLENDIQDLEIARDRLKACKDEYIRLQKQTVQIAYSPHKWKGQRYNEGKNYFGVAKVQDKRNVDAIDEALDTVERDIGRLEAKRAENIYGIKNLTQAYYSLKHELNALRN